MRYYADLHVHSRYSRATSRDCDLENLALWAQRKGIAVVGTGDFTHPAWMAELRQKLVPAEPGLFRLRRDLERDVSERVPRACRRDVRFLLQVEISTIYKAAGATRKVHHLVYAPDFATADRLVVALSRIGNLASDGRPILALDSRELLELVLDSGEDAYLVPAHIWTPWFSALGSRSGFDSIDECYGDLAEHVFAVETGLSSDPPMNWSVPSLDRFRLVSNSDAHSPRKLGREACVFEGDPSYFAIRDALRDGDGYVGTLEFFPEEGKYHLDGHRKCGIRLEPGETAACGGRCPSCGAPVTVGVLHRVTELAGGSRRGAGRAAGQGNKRSGASRRPAPRTAGEFTRLLSLPEILGELHGLGAGSNRVGQTYDELLGRVGPELYLLRDAPLDEVEGLGGALVAEALRRLRRGAVRTRAGFDGEYGVVRLFDDGELAPRGRSQALFDGDAATTPTAGDRTRGDTPSGADFVRFAERPDAERDRVEDADAIAAGRLDARQREAVEHEAARLLVRGAAGTGKSTVLAHRAARWIEVDRVRPERVLIVARTRSAGERVRATIAARLRGDATSRPDVRRAERARRIVVHTPTTLAYAVLDFARAGHAARPLEIASRADRVDALQHTGRLTDREAERHLVRLLRAQRGMTATDSEASPTRGSRRSRVGRPRDPALHDPPLHGPRGVQNAETPTRLDTPAIGAGDPLAAMLDAYAARLEADGRVDLDDLERRALRALEAGGRLPHTPTHVAVDDLDEMDPVQRAMLSRILTGAPRLFVTAGTRAPGGSTRRVAPPTRLGADDLCIGPASHVTLSTAHREARGPRSGPRAPRAAPTRTLHVAEDRGAEAAFCAAAIRARLGLAPARRHDLRDDPDPRAARPDEVALLVRSAAAAAPYVRALRKAGVPCRVVDDAPLLDQPGVRELLAHRGARPHESIPKTVSAAFEAVGRPRDRDLAAARDALLRIAERYADTPWAFDAFDADVAFARQVDDLDRVDPRVSVLTLDAARGLEFRAVFLVGCEQGVLPEVRGAPLTPEELQDERRRFLVGLTRAREEVVLTRARTRVVGGRRIESAPSPFLAAVDVEERDAEAPAVADAPPVRQRELF